MSRLLPLALALVAPLYASGCRRTPCEELVAAPIAGTYRGGGTLAEARLLKVALEASAQQVVLTYTTLDGSRIRAKYRVTKKTRRREAQAR